MRYVMKEKTKLIINCVNRNGENVVTTILNLIQFFNIQNYKNWVRKRTS
jgi:hypothetical protein